MSNNSTGANLGFEDKLWMAADKLRGTMDTAEYKHGEFDTPQCVVKLLVEMLEPYSRRVYDPCCGSGGMFVQPHSNGNGDGNGIPNGVKPDKVKEDIRWAFGTAPASGPRRQKDGDHGDKPGSCKSAPLDDTKSHHDGLTPGGYVGTEAIVDDGIPIEKKRLSFPTPFTSRCGNLSSCTR